VNKRKTSPTSHIKVLPFFQEKNYTQSQNENKKLISECKTNGIGSHSKFLLTCQAASNEILAYITSNGFSLFLFFLKKF